MAYDNIISRTDAGSILTVQETNEVLNNLQDESAALKLFKTAPTMTAGTSTTPVLVAIPIAYFVNGDTGLRQTTEANWDKKTFTAEEIAAIVPISKKVLADANRDIWADLRPLLQQAVGRALDAAIFFGTNKPASWPAAIVPQALAAGNTVTRGTTVALGGITQDINLLMGLVEDDGFDVNGFAGNVRFKRYLRGAYDSAGRRIDLATNQIEGVAAVYPMPGMWPTGTGAVELIAGDFTQGAIAIREDINFYIQVDGVITDNTNAIIYNLPQQGMIALHVTFRAAWQVSNTVTWVNSNDGTRWPWATMLTP